MVSYGWAPAAALLSSALTLDLAAAQSSREPRFKFDGSGTRVIEVSNLPSDGCPGANSVGRITKRHIENGRLVAVSFKDRRREEYLNLPDASEFRNKAAYERVREALDSMLTPGAEVRVRMAACGAAGAIVALEAITLVSGPSGQAAPSLNAARPSPTSGLTPDTSDESAENEPLRTPGGGASRTAAPAAEARRSVPVAPAQIASTDMQNAKDGWLIQGDKVFTSMGLVSGMHYHTIQMTCQHQAGTVEVVIDDPKARYAAGSRQSFTLTSGPESTAIQGIASYDDMDDVRQISATVPLSVLQPVLNEMAGRTQMSVITRAGRTALRRAEGAKTASAFLLSCSRGR